MGIQKCKAESESLLEQSQVLKTKQNKTLPFWELKAALIAPPPETQIFITIQLW